MLTALREQPAGMDAPALTTNGLKVLEKRYIERKGHEPLETAGGRLWAVAMDVARGSERFGSNRELVAQLYYGMMSKGDFLPNSPTLMNAGKENGLQYSACYVLPIGDSMEEIFETVKRAALVHKSGGGTGFAFSRLRPAGDVVGSTGGVASGPISFMEVFNAATEQVKQGGTRRGANMGILRVDHPDVLDFIECKRKLRGRNKEAFDAIAHTLSPEQAKGLQRALLEGQISNFNISIAITDEFMEALERGGSYGLVHPVTKDVVKELSAREVFKLICECAWETGDPGLVFIDRINNSRSNPVPTLEQIEATNPCGEQALGENDVCNLGSINLGHCVEEYGAVVNWTKLESLTRLSTRFLDDVITVNPYPDDLIRKKAYANRRLGLGVMGWADMLIKLAIPYDSEEALDLGLSVMDAVTDWAHDESRHLAEEREPFPNFDESIYATGAEGPLRNATLTTVAPTGTISIIAGCSSGIEPMFALVFDRKGSLDGALDLETYQPFIDTAKREGFWSEDLARQLLEHGTVRGLDAVPEKWQRVFGTAHDIAPEWHIRMQASFQKATDNSISKTINLPHGATVADIEAAYLLAWETGCKGTTVYRDGSKEGVLHVGSKPVVAEAPIVREHVNGVVHDALTLPSSNVGDVVARQNGSGVSNGHVPPTSQGGHSAAARLGDRPRKLTGHTYRSQTPLGAAYITINEDENGEPYEVFVNQGKAGSDIAPLSEAIGKLASMLLRVPSSMDQRSRLRVIARKLRGIGGASSVGFGADRTRSLPDALAKVLDEYLTPTDRVENAKAASSVAPKAKALALDICPDCHCMMAEEEGCAKCYNCGYAKC